MEFGVETDWVRWTTFSLFLGLCIGASFWGTASDIVGRRFAFNTTLFIGALFGTAVGGGPNWHAVCALFSCMGIGIGGNLPVDGALFLEFLPFASGNLLVSILPAITFASKKDLCSLCVLDASKHLVACRRFGLVHDRLGLGSFVFLLPLQFQFARLYAILRVEPTALRSRLLRSVHQQRLALLHLYSWSYHLRPVDPPLHSLPDV